MKKTFRQYLTESQRLPHWPKTKDELIKAYQKIMIDEDTGEVMMPPYYDDEHPVPENLRQYSHTNFTTFNDDLTVSVKSRFGSGDRIQIHKWMLVDGHLPFPFKEVSMDFEIEKGCDLKSLAGTPQKCESFAANYGALGTGVKNFIGGPEEVETAYIVQLCDGITSTVGLPKAIPNGKLELTCDYIEDFSHLPKEVNELVIGRSPHFTEEDFKYLPSHAEFIAFTSLKGLKSFHNLHKHVKSLHRLGLYEVRISSSILGLAMISNLSEVDEYFYDVNSDDKDWPTDGIIQIVNKYIGTNDVFEFQEELVDAGLTELAKL